ncbi:LysE family translocator (plasmid) [Agrobacterium sp. rho-13.3]|uniref:LysE family translocator n=1 Tax=Agrobacterium sp. rho-13.3 TaxID=3072980 RepID=UPI002A151774|nr:LysE family transporter [Agrobacterium sp. rho-13.3]MDX8310179.1 LysE family transporter [Agrobacterium sp. rho-13.3]
MPINELIFLGSIASLYTMLAISPGPNFLIITTKAISQSRRHAIFTGLGVSTASVIWSGLAALGLGTLIGYFDWAQRLLQIAGGAYLIYIGIKMIWKSKQPLPSRAEVDLTLSAWQGYRQGLATNLTNPKTLVFFSSAFATLFTPDLAIWAKISAVLLVASISVVLNVAIATAFSGAVARRNYTSAKPVIDSIAGGLLAFFGGKLILSR